MSEHQVIWLQPWCSDCERNNRGGYENDRTWCQDLVYDRCECGAMPVKYVMIFDQPKPPSASDEEE